MEYRCANQDIKNGRLYLLIFQWLIIVIAFALLCNRIRFGIDFTDESWYVAEPYIVAKGAIPYVNNWTQAPGFTLPLALLFKLYVMVTGGTEGIVLFSRVLYVIVSLGAYTVITVIISKRTRQLGVFIMIFPLLFPDVFSLYDLTYNTMGVMYLFVACSLLFFEAWGNSGEGEKNVIVLILSGVIVARAIIASPSVLAAWIGILIIMTAKKKWYEMRYFIAGNIIAAILVIGWCCIRGGFSGFLNGMRVFLTETAYFHIRPHHTFQDDIIFIFRYCEPLLAAIFLLVIIKILREKKLFSSKESYKSATLTVCVACLMIGAVKGGYSRNYTYLIQYGWFETILIALFVENENEDKKSIVSRFAWISGLYFAVYILTSATNIYGFGGREFWLLIPTVLGSISLYFVLKNKALVVTAVFSINLLLGVLLLKQNYMYVYRDQPIANLTTEVDYGIWKGCYTTPERAENVKLLEEYIRNVTNKDDSVLFLDQVCFAYLMTDGKACTPATHDPMIFSYKVNTPEVMYEYFESVGKIPNKIIYIDFGRDEELSIDSDWKFNKFVNENYELIETYDTNSKIADKSAEGQINTASFAVKYYNRLSES